MCDADADAWDAAFAKVKLQLHAYGPHEPHTARSGSWPLNVNERRVEEFAENQNISRHVPVRD